MPVKPVAFKVPKKLGECADLLYTTRQERYALGAKVKAMEAIEKQLEDHIIATLPKSESTGVAGKVARVSVPPAKTVPRVEDWPAFYAYVLKKKAFEMLQKRLAEAAIQERWDAGEKVPGVGTFSVVKCSVTKI